MQTGQRTHLTTSAVKTNATPRVVTTPLNASNPTADQSFFASSIWEVASASATASYCKILPGSGCVTMGHGRNGVCKITALKTIFVQPTSSSGLGLVTVNGNKLKLNKQINEGDKLACKLCTDCVEKKMTTVKICAAAATTTTPALSRPIPQHAINLVQSATNDASCTDLVSNWTDTQGRPCSKSLCNARSVVAMAVRG